MTSDVLSTNNNVKNGTKRPRKFNLLQSNQIYRIFPRGQRITNAQATNEERRNDIHLIGNWGLPDPIVRYYSSKGITQFFPWQVEALEQPGVLDHYQNLVYSAPTSAGKTMVSDVLLYKNTVERKKKAIIILPFVSITVEKVESLKKMMNRIGVKIDKFAGNVNPKGGFARVDIAVCTIEKANNMVNRLIEEGNLSDVGLVIVDELHMLGDSSRGYLLELLLTKILFYSKRSNTRENLVQIVGMSATIPNLPDIARWLSAQLYITDFRPVPLYERIVQVVDKNRASVVEYDKANPKCDFKILASIDTRELGIDDDEAALIYTSIETVLNGFSALIFCSTKQQCEKLSRAIASNIYEFGAKKKLQTQRAKEVGDKIRLKLNFDKIQNLVISLEKSPTGLDILLKESIRFGVAFHHAGMSTDERSAIEEAFRHGVVKILCSTTTLSAGVNLPARRVLITSPFNYRGGLLDVITYRQMIGRAGRKGIDELGEAYMFCRSKDFEQAQMLFRSDIEPIKSCLLRLQTSSSNSEDSNSDSSDLFSVAMSESLKKAIIEIISNGTATNKSDVIEYCKCTFFNESFRSRLSEEKKETGSHFETAIDQVFDYLSTNQLIYLNNNPDSDELQTRVYVSNLGKAIVASGILPDDGQFIQKELDRARSNLSLVNDLHLVYQVTPTYISNQLNSIDWQHYLEIWTKLSPDKKQIGEKIGVTMGSLSLRCNSTLNQNDARQREMDLIQKRFYASLALNDLIQEIPLPEVAKKYLLVKGQIQSLQQQAATFAGMLATFCNKLGWFSMELLIEQFQPRLAFGIQRELIDLMRITFLPAQVARSLYKHYQTLKDMVYERFEDIERTIVQGMAFDTSEDCDPKTRLIFVPALEQHFTISEFAKKVLEEARDIIQIEIGQKLNFELPDSPSNNTEPNNHLSPIKVESNEIQTVADKFVQISSSTPVVSDRGKAIKTECVTNMSLDDLFDDDIEFSFGATPNKQTRLEQSISSTPAAAASNNDNTIPSSKNRSSKKLNFLIDDKDLENAGPSKQHDIPKENFKIVESCKSQSKNNSNTFPADNSKYNVNLLSTSLVTPEIKSSGIVEDYDALLDNSLNDMSWSEMLDKVKNTSSSSSSSKICPLITSPSCSSAIITDSCIVKNKALSPPNNETKISDSSTEKHYNELFDQLTTNNDLNISNRMDRLSSHDSGAPKTDDLILTNSSSFSFDDDEEFSAIFKSDHTKNSFEDKTNDSSKLTSDLETTAIQTSITEALPNDDSSNSSFKFEEDITHDDLDEIVKQHLANIEPADLNDDCSSSSLSFFQTFKNNCFNSVPDCLENTDILLDKLAVNTVTTAELLEELISFIDDQSLNLMVHFVVKPFSEPAPIIHAPRRSSSIINFFEPEPPKGLIIRDGNPIELFELFITIPGQSTVYRIDSSEYFLLFIERFRNILARIEPLFEDGSRSPFSVKSNASDSPKSIRILSYDIKLCLHLFVRGFKLPMNALVKRIEWFDLSVAVWLLDPEGEYFNIKQSTIQDLIELSLVHSLDQSFVQKVRLYELSLNRSGDSSTTKAPKYNKRRAIEDSPHIGMLKTIMLSNLMKLFLNKLIDKNLYKSYKLIEIPARLLFAVMEMRGIQIDDIVLEFEQRRLSKFMKYLEQRIFRLVGQKFNIASPDQVARVLFQDQGLLSNYFNVTKVASCSKTLQPNRRIPKILSTNKLALIKLQEACGSKTNLPTLIMEWRRLNNSFTKCVQQIIKSLDSNQLVFCHLDEWTSTGRIAMHDPNLINVDKDYEITNITNAIAKRLLDNTSDEEDNDIDSAEFNKSSLSPTKPAPVSKPIKIRLRKAIIAREGYCLVSADYRQLELRILAHFAKDQQLLSTLNDPSDDVFRCIASGWLNVEPDQVTYEARQQAKQICYGILYGMGDNSLADSLAVSVDEAKEIRKSFMEKYSSIQDFIEKTVEICQKNEFIEMISNRRRILPHINSNNCKLASKARRQAVNSVIQGSAADCIKLAMIAVDSAIRKAGFDAALILQMHDELMYEVADAPHVPDKFKPIEFARLLKTQMEDVSKHFKVTLPVKVQTGKSWADLHEISDI